MLKKTGFYMAMIGVGCILLLSLGSIYAEQMSKAVIIAAFMMILFYMIRRTPERAGYGRKAIERMQINETVSNIRFRDVAANQEAVRSLSELADYLKEPEKYCKMGARMPRGVLMYGPPGTGKTLLARAMAGEAGVPFYSISGSDFVQMYVGVGASRVRNLFAKARKAGRCVIFIDEIDSMGKKREDSLSDERDQTINALLAEMSGFKDTDGVLVLAATNRIDVLDPALIRPGRFDRHIEVGLPGRNERYDILKLHLRNKPISPSVDIETLAFDTIRFSGASLESLVNEAAINAVRRGAEAIEQQDIDCAYVAAVAGVDRPVNSSRKELAIIALHEAGHAIASLCLFPEHRLSRISILPSSRGAAGYNLTIPSEHTVFERSNLCAQIQVLLAGRAAELLVNGREGITSGGANDLERAAELASAMVMDLGMENEMAVALRILQKNCSSSTQDGLASSRSLLERQFSAVQELLTDHLDDLMKLTEELLRQESMNNQAIIQLLPHFFESGL